MIITEPLLKALTITFTIEELRAKVIEYTTQLATQGGDTIISATTGSGEGYTKQITARLDELVVLFSSALDYAENGGQMSTGSGCVMEVWG